jgi:hypothetical protein
MQIYGALYAQMVFGESFEEQPATVSQPRLVQGLPLGWTWIQSVVNDQVYIRHCDYVLWETTQIAPMGDFLFDVVPALNGNPNAVSFVPSNYPTYYLSLQSTAGTSSFNLSVRVTLLQYFPICRLCRGWAIRYCTFQRQ